MLRLGANLGDRHVGFGDHETSPNASAQSSSAKIKPGYPLEARVRDDVIRPGRTAQDISPLWDYAPLGAAISIALSRNTR